MLLLLSLPLVIGLKFDQVLENSPKPHFLANATDESIKHFMAIYRTPGIPQLRKMTELDVFVGTLRPEVQQAYNSFKAESILVKMSQDERFQEIAEKAHFVMAHLLAIRETSAEYEDKKARTEVVFSEFSDFLVDAISEEMGNILDMVMRQMLRAFLFTERIN